MNTINLPVIYTVDLGTDACAVIKISPLQTTPLAGEITTQYIAELGFGDYKYEHQGADYPR